MATKVEKNLWKKYNELLEKYNKRRDMYILELHSYIKELTKPVSSSDDKNAIQNLPSFTIAYLTTQ